MKKHLKKIRFAAAFIFCLLALLLFFYLAFLRFYQDKFFPGTKIAGQNVGGQRISDASKNLNAEYGIRKDRPLNLIYQNQTLALNLNNALPETNLQEIIQTAYKKGRTGNIPADLKEQFNFLIASQDFSPEVKFNNYSAISSRADLINQKIRKDAIPAQIIFSEDKIDITPSQEGIEMDYKSLSALLKNYLALKDNSPAIIPTKPILPNLTTAKAQKYKKILEAVKKSPIKLHSGNDTWTIDEAALYSLLDFNNTKTQLASLQKDNQDFTIEEISIGTSLLSDNGLILDQDKLLNFINNIAGKINQPLKEAKFVFDEGAQRVTEFQPGQERKQLIVAQTVSLISKAVENGGSSDIQLPVEITSPQTSAGEVNDYGIKELLGTGTSSFIDSIPNRVFNIGLAGSRTNGILIPPGETFSFNQYIGEISAATGYKQAYVIKAGKTVLDDGGGVCQVSTTLFRAVLNAGLPITERTAHAYRVGFYEQGGTPPGFDATVYPPSVDFKFKNDTKNYILIQNQMIGTNLIFKIYGTSDGRTTIIGKPVVLSQTPPPPDLRQDDPTLPKGVEKEIEHSIWGMNTQFKRTVVRDGETIIDETWRSNFRPWQKITLVGTKE